MTTPVQEAIKIAGSQQALATACGVSQSAVSKWVLGGGVSVENAINISRATSGRVSVADLRPDVLDGLKLALKDLA
jgi:DNA-binding transcriptional regulator YdaS (Cro superfamily)